MRKLLPILLLLLAAPALADVGFRLQPGDHSVPAQGLPAYRIDLAARPWGSDGNSVLPEAERTRLMKARYGPSRGEGNVRDSPGLHSTDYQAALEEACRLWPEQLLGHRGAEDGYTCTATLEEISDAYYSHRGHSLLAQVIAKRLGGSSSGARVTLAGPIWGKPGEELTFEAAGCAGAWGWRRTGGAKLRPRRTGIVGFTWAEPGVFTVTAKSACGSVEATVTISAERPDAEPGTKPEPEPGKGGTDPGCLPGKCGAEPGSEPPKPGTPAATCLILPAQTVRSGEPITYSLGECPKEP